MRSPVGSASIYINGLPQTICDRNLRRDAGNVSIIEKTVKSDIALRVQMRWMLDVSVLRQWCVLGRFNLKSWFDLNEISCVTFTLYKNYLLFLRLLVIELLGSQFYCFATSWSLSLTMF